jgi:hypothetical protein
MLFYDKRYDKNEIDQISNMYVKKPLIVENQLLVKKSPIDCYHKMNRHIIKLMNKMNINNIEISSRKPELYSAQFSN